MSSAAATSAADGARVAGDGAVGVAGTFLRGFEGVVLRLASHVADAVPGQDPSLREEGKFHWVKWVFELAAMILAPVVVCFCLMVCVRVRLSEPKQLLLRCVGFIVLHVADYTTNVLVMLIVFSTKHYPFLITLIPVHCIIGIFCLYTASTNTDWQKWSCGPLLNFLFMAVVMGLMQGIQVKLACDDYQLQRSQRAEDADGELSVPAMMPARFQCKAMDGILEGTVFAIVTMYAILKKDWDELNPIDLTEPQALVFYLAAVFSFLTVGLAVMEVDHRTSASVQRVLNRSTLAQARHLAFRTSETTVRLLTILVFITFMRPIKQWQWFIVILALDYLFGVGVLMSRGGRDPVRQAVWLLGAPFLFVNVMQFVDAPGLSLQARRISKVIVPVRIAEMVGVIIFCLLVPSKISLKGNDHHKVSVREFLVLRRTDFLAFWVISMGMYIFLLFTYAMKMKPEADLHSAVAYGETERLRELLTGSELVLDVNRYGPDGRTPLHLAAAMGHLECLQLLIEEKANLNARTGDKAHDTALHLASANSHQAVVRFLLRTSRGDASFVNAQNMHGDTALHVAARRHHVVILRELLRSPAVSASVKNKRDQTPAECAPSEDFRFDRNSPESATMELLQSAEAGTYVRPARVWDPSLELSQLDGGSAPGSSCDPPSIAAAPSMEQAASTEAAFIGGEGGEAVTSIVSSQHQVALVDMDLRQEEEFLRRTGGDAAAAARRPTSMLSTNCGISSFMLSAGMGAMSRAVLTTLREDAAQDASSPGGESRAGVSFDDFTEIKALGEGAFGKVLLVRHTVTGELYALKTMDKAKFRAQKITSKAHTEQYILKTTRHPFIVTLHYAFQGSTFWALVMEYCPNGDLQHILGYRGSPGLTAPDAGRYGGEVLLALHHLHSMNVIFRDLKLENVVIDSEYHAKVADFGFAKKLRTANDARTMCGSYGYVAPEIMLNTGRYSVAVDLYSYGVVMFMLLSGGDPRQNNPRERLPPMRHAQLRRRLRDAEKSTERPPWASEQLGGLHLVMQLTSDVPEARKTSTEVKEHRFYKAALGRSVECLLEEAERGGGGALGSGGRGGGGGAEAQFVS